MPPAGAVCGAAAVDRHGRLRPTGPGSPGSLRAPQRPATSKATTPAKATLAGRVTSLTAVTTIEQLERDVWPDPGLDGTPLVRRCTEL